MIRIVFASMLVLAVGCGSAEPPGTGSTAGDPSGDQDPSQNYDPNAGLEGQNQRNPGTPPAPPGIDERNTSTSFESHPIRGMGPPNGYVLINGQDFLDRAEVGSSGLFCTEVPLKRGMQNTFELKAQDRWGNQSTQVTTVHITQAGTATQSQNVPSVNTANARGVSAKSNMRADGGNDGMMIDGRPDTIFNPVEYPGFTSWVWITLPSPKRLQMIEVESPGDCRLQRYALLVSSEASPGDPAEGSAKWVNPRQGDIVGTGHDQITVPTDREVRHIGLRFKSQDCGWGWVGTATHKISEIKAWTVGTATSSGGGAPRCF